MGGTEFSVAGADVFAVGPAVEPVVVGSGAGDIRYDSRAGKVCQ